MPAAIWAILVLNWDKFVTLVTLLKRRDTAALTRVVPKAIFLIVLIPSKALVIPAEIKADELTVLPRSGPGRPAKALTVLHNRGRGIHQHHNLYARHVKTGDTDSKVHKHIEVAMVKVLYQLLAFAAQLLVFVETV